MSKIADYLSGSLDDSNLKLFPHHIYLSPNLHAKHIVTLEDETNDLCNFTTGGESNLKCTVPLPLLPMKKASKSFFYGVDPVMELVEKKSQWKNMVKQAVISFPQGKRLMDSIKSELKSKKDVKHLPHCITLLAKILEMDPDDQFDGFYNWYYCGGCLNHINLQGKNFLLRSGGKKFNRLVAVPLSCNESTYVKPDLANESYESIKNQEPIHQIISNERNGLVAARQKKKCLIFSISDESKYLSFKNVQEIDSSFPFTSIDFDKTIEENYVTMNTNGKCCIQTINRKNPIRHWTVPDSSDKFLDKWCWAMYGQNKDTLICTNRRYIRTYDTRAKKMNSMEICPGEIPNVLEKCEEVTCIVEGTRKMSHPLLYLATQHKLLAMDLRFPRTFIQSWTHGMKHAPCYISTEGVHSATDQNLQEVVVLCSQISNEIHGIVNSFSPENDCLMPFSRVFPLSLPSYQDTLSLAHWHGKLLDPLIQKRLSTATVGLCCFESPAGGITCMTRNSLGDVFQQHLLPRNMKEFVKVEDVVRCVSAWEKSEPKLKKPRKKLEVVVRTDQKNLFNCIKARTGVIEPSGKQTVSGEWKISKTRLFLFNDMLAPKLLKAWEIEDVPEWIAMDELEDKDEEPSLPPTQEPLDKVENWIRNINLFTSTPIASQELQHDIQNSNTPQLFESQFTETSVDANQMLNKSIVSKRRLTTQSTPQLKKKRFVDGF